MAINDPLPMVSIGIAVWNGEAFLAKTLQSFVQQDYQNIEIIILDNQSTDLTATICKEFAARDSRVRYILDDEKRDVMSAQIKVAHLAKGEFYMTACDDDWYEPSYISTLMNVISQNPSIGVAYCAMGFIDEEGNKSSSYPVNFLRHTDNPVDNFRRYLARRDPVPMIFGVVRRETHLDALSFYKKADARGWNHDNLYILRLLSQTRVEGISDILFYYRQRNRELLYRQRNQADESRSPFEFYFNHFLHQWSVKNAIERIIDLSPFTEDEKRSLKRSNYRAFLHYVRWKYLRESIKGTATWKKIQSIFG